MVPSLTVIWQTGQQRDDSGVLKNSWRCRKKRYRYLPIDI